MVWGCLLTHLYGTVSFAIDNPIAFVTYVPNPQGFGTISETFGNHLGSYNAAVRGGDLYIRYPNGTLKNITAAAGYGNTGFQGASSIAVRDPVVHWNGEKIAFSMVIGAPTSQYSTPTFYWQLYEVTGLNFAETPVITKISNQPESYNNVMPAYGSDGSIIFVSDRPVTGERHLYPQRDEYESAPTNTGVWKLSPGSGTLVLLDHSPSGDFNPFIDSYGRVLFTRWDHMQRDQQNIGVNFGAFNFNGEGADSIATSSNAEVYPEPRTNADPEYDSRLNTHSFNHFFPWQINQDGTELETLNHIGRHELHSYIQRSFTDDSDLDDFYRQYSRTNPNPILNFFHISEDPNTPGRYLGIDAPEFATHSAGQIVAMEAAPNVKAGDMSVEYLTHRDTAGSDATPSADHHGLSRTPRILSEGTLIASHSTSTLEDSNIGTSTSPQSRYSFRLKTFSKVGPYYVPTSNLTSGISKTLSYWDPDKLVSYTGATMWEMQPVEVVARQAPGSSAEALLAAPEQAVLSSKGVALESLKSYLIENNLALVISRNVTVRDALDVQQPFNLKIAGASTKTTASNGKLYEISALQFFIGKLIRGYQNLLTGRRVIPQNISDITAHNPESSGPIGSVALGADGSMAAFVPARRALTWQLTDSQGEGVVRERYWVTFQPGEIRVCASCHGVTSTSQAGGGEPLNEPQALGTLLDHWLQNDPGESVSKVTIKAAKVGARYRISGKVLSSGGDGIAANVSLKQIRGGATTTIVTKDSGASGAYSFKARVKSRVKVYTSVGNVRSKTVRIR